MAGVLWVGDRADVGCVRAVPVFEFLVRSDDVALCVALVPDEGSVCAFDPGAIRVEDKGTWQRRVRPSERKVNENGIRGGVAGRVFDLDLQADLFRCALSLLVFGASNPMAVDAGHRVDDAVGEGLSRRG